MPFVVCEKLVECVVERDPWITQGRGDERTAAR